MQAPRHRLRYAQWSSLGNNCQQWAVIPGGNGKYKYMLVPVNSGMVLDDVNCGTANGTKADLWQWGR